MAPTRKNGENVCEAQGEHPWIGWEHPWQVASTGEDAQDAEELPFLRAVVHPSSSF